ncbi:MAG: LVIVD repeat-containing protein [Prolixibacteraceae bacterium]
MNKYTQIVGLFSIVLILAIMQSCQDETYMKYTANSPVYMSYDDLRDAVKIVDAQALEHPGKIYFKDNYIYINEYMKGIHVYDNTDPSDPQQISFITIPGNVDMVIRNNYLYADSYIDLVVLDIANMQNPIEIDREDSIFEYTLPEYDEEYELAQIDRTKGVVVGWEIKEVKELVRHESYYYPIYWGYGGGMMEDALVNYSSGTKTGGAVSGGGTEFGVGGSMARFGQSKDYLLILKNSWQVSTYNVQGDGKIELEGDWSVGWSIETMFIRDETMFIGSQSGMFIYDISELPVLNQLSQFMHFTSCDPVIADDQYAYITLRTGGACGRGQNVLEVVDVSDLRNPIRVRTYQMKSPNGLGKDDDLLFICDGEDGLKVFDAANPDKELPILAHFKDIHAFDVIPLGTILFMVGDDGFYQYDYTDIQNITLLSEIHVVKTIE